MSKGRSAKVTEEIYLDAVRRKRTDKDIVIAQYLGVHRSNIGRFKKNNPKVVEKGKVLIEGFTTTSYDFRNITFEAYERMPVINQWRTIQKDRISSDITIKARLRAIYNVCKHLNTHPDNLTLEMVETLVKEAKRHYYADEQFIRGIAYTNIRKPIRSFFQLIHGVSGEMLSTLGIDAEASKGSGSQSKERITKEQRSKFMLVLYDSVHKAINEEKRFEQYRGKEELIYLEMKGLTYFMYYTATRIGSPPNNNTQGSLSIRMNNNKHKLSKDKWEINLMDKGKKGGIEWNKILIDDGLTKMKEYITSRFKINIDEIETQTQTIGSYLFPILNTDYDFERTVMKIALNRAGVNTKIPNHIWRHTFAQDFLHASDWNYELCASIGGWKDTGTLKKHYGKMSEDAKERGLRKAMGLPVEDVTYELRF